MNVLDFLGRPEVADILAPAQIRALREIASGTDGKVAFASECVDGDEVIDVWCDGSCLGNPGRGGWAACFDNGQAVYGNDGGRATTNNQMEIRAVIGALRETPIGSRVRVHSDSALVINTMTAGWATNKNKELWAELKQLAAARNVSWTWIRGHGDDVMNNEADKLARAAANMPPIDGVKHHSGVGVTVSTA
jgi:ribonuclease HI